jgi:hypothetical protein
MTAIWGFVWVICHTPAVTFSPDVNDWAFWLVVAVAVDLLGLNSGNRCRCS